jgi:Flp pilus assembly pilin Flp
MKTQVQLKSKRGQNTAEYLIMLTLVAIGSIGLMTAFGKTIQSKIAYVSAAIAGDENAYKDSKNETKNRAEKANAKVKRPGDIKMEGIDQADLKSE